MFWCIKFLLLAAFLYIKWLSLSTILIMHLFWRIANSFVRYVHFFVLRSFHNSGIEIVRTRQPWNNLYFLSTSFTSVDSRVTVWSWDRAGTVWVPDVLVLVMTEDKHKGCSRHRSLARSYRQERSHGPPTADYRHNPHSKHCETCIPIRMLIWKTLMTLIANSSVP